jgi:hypothetical protein
MQGNRRFWVIAGIIALFILGGAAWEFWKADGFRAGEGIPVSTETNSTSSFSFENYPSEEAYLGVPHEPDFSTNPAARQFETVIREGAKQGPNFNGHYTVIFYGCGTACQAYALLDARDGRIVTFGESFFTSTRGAGYRLTSSLLILDPYESGTRVYAEEGSVPPVRYYAFRGGRFEYLGGQTCSVSATDELLCL